MKLKTVFQPHNDFTITPERIRCYRGSFVKLKDVKPHDAFTIFPHARLPAHPGMLFHKIQQRPLAEDFFCRCRIILLFQLEAVSQVIGIG